VQHLTTKSLELLPPSRALLESYRSHVAEFIAAGEPLIPFPLRFDHTDFDAMLAQFEACSRGLGVGKIMVAHSTYWLVRNGVDVVGVSNIRHALTPALERSGGTIGFGIRPSARRQHFATEILRQSLQRANELGVTSVLLTCSKANVASARAMLRNGAVLESEEYLSDEEQIIQRYRIELAR